MNVSPDIFEPSLSITPLHASTTPFPVYSNNQTSLPLGMVVTPFPFLTLPVDHYSTINVALDTFEPPLSIPPLLVYYNAPMSLSPDIVDLTPPIPSFYS